MVEWKELGELGKFENIGTDKKIIEGEKLITLLNYVDVYHHKYIDSSIPKMIVSASDKKIEDCSVEEGDIFVTPSSETVDDIGHSSVITETIPNAVYSYHIMRYRLFKKNILLSYYINYVFDTENVKKQILKKAQGLTRFGLSKDKFASILVPIPSLREQNRVVGILKTFSDSIENLIEQIAERRKQYEYYCDQLLDLEGREKRLIGELFEFKNGLNKEKKYFGQGNPIVNYTDVYHHNKITQEILNGRVTLDDNEIERFRVKRGDVFFTRTSETPEEIGYAAVLLDDIKDCTFSGFLLRARPTTNMLLPEFCGYCFSSYKVRQAIIKLSTYTTRALTNGTSLSKISIPVPSLSEQSRIVSILDTFEASISNLEAQLKEREKQYEYYRNKLLTFE